MKVHIKSSSLNYDLEEYLKPELIYIPLENKSGVEYKSLVKDKDYVYKGSIVAINEKLNFPIHSSVSGYVLTITTKLINNGKKVKCLVIQNDFKEKYEKSRINVKKDMTKEEFVELLRNNGITGLGGSDFPTFLKYNNDNNKYLLVNGVECEPYISCDKAVIYNYAEELLEAIDKVSEIMNVKNTYIVVKNNSNKTIKALNKYLGTYPNIKLSLVDDIYPNGWERLVVKNTLGLTYDKYPTEKGIIVSNVSTMYAMYEMLKYNRPITERIITITGGVNKRCNIKVKVGSLASDVIKSLDGYKNIKNPLFVVGGPMMGKSLPSDDVIITKDVNAIMVLNNDFDKPLPCINCAKCTEVCPVSLKPVLIMKTINKDKKLKYLDPNRCIECGLCSYICPSKIEVREFVRAAKEKVNK